MYQKPDYTHSPDHEISFCYKNPSFRTVISNYGYIRYIRYTKPVHLCTIFLSKICSSITPHAYFSRAIASSLVAFKQRICLHFLLIRACYAFLQSYQSAPKVISKFKEKKKTKKKKKKTTLRRYTCIKTLLQYLVKKECLLLNTQNSSDDTWNTWIISHHSYSWCTGQVLSDLEVVKSIMAHINYSIFRIIQATPTVKVKLFLGIAFSCDTTPRSDVTIERGDPI
jgi:hypothetical protein